ncbi:hypothetical protein [Thermolongibacillus altinsuensis]|uniref:hypothetical protein n=1 Tax=Thermolongibacillus altinsuensis TaxID=575256 RepID=UPI00104B6D69|nr:hypothetical protein [Thermolongibacillus altinsuensis]
MPPRHARSMPIPNVKRMTDKFICLMAFLFGEVAEKLVYVGKLSLSYILQNNMLSLSSFSLLSPPSFKPLAKT